MTFNSLPSDGVERGRTAARSSPSLSQSSPAPSNGRPPTGQPTEDFKLYFGSRSPSAQTQTGSILPGGSSSDGARLRESCQQEDGPSNILSASSYSSGRTPLFGQPPSRDESPSKLFSVNSSTRQTPLFGQSSSNASTPLFPQYLSPAHPSVQGDALFGASSANARQSRASSPQSRGASNMFSPASPSTEAAALLSQSSSRAGSIFSFQALLPSVQPPNNKALFSRTSENNNTSQETTPQNNSSPSLFAQPSWQPTTSRVVSPQNSSAANYFSTHTAGALLFGPGSASAGSSKDLGFHGSPSNIFGPRSNTSSPLPSPLRPASSSTISSRGRVLTPLSDSGSLSSAFASKLDLNTSPGPASRSPSVDQPQILRSIEQQDDAPATPVVLPNRRGTTSSSTSQTMSVHDRIPSLSLSPPEQGRDSGARDIGSIDRNLAQLRLSASTPTHSSTATPSRTNTEMDINIDDNALLTPRPSPRRRRSGSAAAEPYNIRDETPPDDRFNAAPFQSALSGAKTLMGELANVLGSGALHRKPGSAMSRLYAKAQGLNEFEFPSRRMVGFVGDSGTGKSSLLNSLLDYENLACANNSGAACTYVATEYHYRRGDDCVIQIERYSPDEIREQMKSLLLSYRQFHLHGNDPGTRVVEDPKGRARLAIDTFKAIFHRRMRDDVFLLAEPEGEVLRTMYKWLEEAEGLLPDEENITVALGECAEKLSGLTSQGPSSDGPAGWPFIKKIKVFVDAHILSKGLILVDLPGLRDVNFARRNITERYIVLCHEIFVVCKMGRAATDSSVEGIFNLAQKANQSHIGIICTNSDDFQIKEESGNCSTLQKRKLQDKIDTCDRDRETIWIIEEDLDDVDSSEAEEMTADQRDAQRNLLLEKRSVERQLEQHEFEITKYLMEIRAQRIDGKLREKYDDRTSACNLSVFFVSNTMYWHNRQEPRNRAERRLELSGIPAVRRYCLGMVSKSQFAVASTVLRDDVGALLGNIELWVRPGAESTAAERRRLEVVEQRMSSLLRRTSELNTISRVFNQEFKDNLFVPGRSQVDAWGAAAARECWQWDGLPHSSYAAFCSRFGDSYTENLDARSWNEEIMKAMNASMEPSWIALSRSSETRMENITSIVPRFVKWAVEYLEAEVHDSPNSFETLIEVLTSHERLVVAEIENAWIDFDNNLRLLHIDATKPMRTSFIGQGMEDAYQAANHESGRGSHARRKSHITNTASSPHLFLTILENSRTKFNDLTSILGDRVRYAVIAYRDSVMETLNFMRGKDAAREGDEDPAFRARVGEEVGRFKEAMRGLITAAGI